MPRKIYAKKPKERMFWRNLHEQMTRGRTVFQLSTYDLKQIRLELNRRKRSRFHPFALYSKFSQRDVPPKTTPPTGLRYRFLSPLEDVTIYGVMKIDPYEYCNDFQGMNRFQVLATYHDGVMRSALYEPWDTCPVLSHSENQSIANPFDNPR